MLGALEKVTVRLWDGRELSLTASDIEQIEKYAAPGKVAELLEWIAQRSVPYASTPAPEIL